MDQLLERLLSAAAGISLRPLLHGLGAGSRWMFDWLGQVLAERLDATLLPPAREPVEPPVPRLCYCGTLHLGTDGHSAFWCLWSPLRGWEVQTSQGWARTGAVAPPRYD